MPMRDRADRLKQARIRAGYTAAKAAAEALGVSPSTYAQHENGIRGFNNDLAARYAAFFRVPVEWIVLGTQRNDPDTFIPLGPRLYVKGEVAAGVWREAWEFAPDEWEVFTGRADISAPQRQRFGLRVRGESMNMIYPPGTILECVQFTDQEIENGKRVIVKRTRDDGGVETTVKEFLTDGEGRVWLVPRSTNPAFQTPIRADEPSQGIAAIEILGIVVASIRPE